MDKATETHDFMSVDSFSQLPFIRPPPLKEKQPIKLFGIEFGGRPDPPEDSDSAEDSNGKDTTTATAADNGESNRKFECHYCCRNFPTSQALGGHQNAHKRERQHAKRAHLHTALSDAQLYGLVNYRITSAPPTLTTPMPNYPTTPITGATSARFYGSPYSHQYHLHQQHQQPINGSPLALWRIPSFESSNPTFNRDRSLHPLPLFAGEDVNMRASSLQVGGSASQLQNRYVYDSKPSVQDHVSLDLHL